MTTVRELLRWMDETYPFALAEDYDNVGLLIGSAEQAFSRCLLALDVTNDVVDEAVRKNAQLILTHHPVIFNPLKRLSPEGMVYRCVQNGIAVIASHTNLDKAAGGVNDVLADKLSLKDVSVLEETDGVARIGTLEKELSPRAFAEHCKTALGAGGVRFAEGTRPVRRVALCSGADDSFLETVFEQGADAYLTGETKHHVAVAAKNLGITLVEAGHFETETVVLPKLKRELSLAFPKVDFMVAEANCPLLEWL